ncbi:MAG: SigE family RNA polymerase sigma factor [Stackebrandtia sp.]
MSTSPEWEFDEFVRARTPALLRSAFLLTSDQQLAEDLVQSALSRTHRAWKRLARLGNAEAYTRKTMYHLQVNWWRRRAREREINRTLHQQETTVASDSADEVVRRRSLQEALVGLAPRQRAVIVLRFYEDRTVTDTAQILGCSEGTVKSQTSKALTRLRVDNPGLSEFAERSFA